MEEATRNPLAAGLDKAILPQPCVLVILGAAGDLTRRKLLPAVYNLALDGFLPASFAVMGFARGDLDDAGFRDVARKGIEKYSRRPIETEAWPDFESALFYTRGSFEDEKAYAELRRRIEEVEASRGIRGNRIFYLSVPPSAIETCVTRLKRAGLVDGRDAGEARVIIEKPIGRDLESAKRINEVVCNVFAERQIFRIDHYLGKETVQSIMLLRFSNSIFEPLWNQKYVDHVQITVAEEEGVGTRAGYYEEAGALRDMVQNHILQLLCLTAMEPPWSLQSEVVRDHKMGVLECLRPLRGSEVETNVVRGQYGAGFHNGVEAPAYRKEDRVAPGSTTETYVAIKAYVDNWRWSGVPFYLRTGKRLPKRSSEIAIQFKAVPPVLFNADPAAALDGNVLALSIQPDEGLSLQIATKLPGPRVRIYPVKMDFRYGSTFGTQSPEAYERLLLDVMVGDATLFMRRDAVEASWSWVTEILKAWEQSKSSSLPEYAAGSWGPLEADRLIGSEGRRWRIL